MIAVGTKLYKEDGKEVTIFYTHNDNISVTGISETMVTFNAGQDRRMEKVTTNETYSINDIGSKLFYNYADTPTAIDEEKIRVKLELKEEQKKKI